MRAPAERSHLKVLALLFAVAVVQMVAASSVYAQDSEDAVASESATQPPNDVVVPPPGLHLRQMVGVAGWPSGLISDSRLQYRMPMHRSSSILFQDTWAGFGARVRATPAFADVGPRITIAPIDIFDIVFQGSYVYYWPTSSGLLPYENITDSTRDFDRGDRHRDEATRARSGSALTASASPTLKAKLGPIIFVDGWTFEYFHISQSDESSKYVYEPFWDRIIARDDLVIDHQAAVLAEIFDGKRSPRTLRVGALFKHRWTLVSEDSTIQLGGVLLFKPGKAAAWPTFAAQVTAYLEDDDRVGGVPSSAFAAIWDLDLRSSNARK